jgi:hypothetical protein
MDHPSQLTTLYSEMCTRAFFFNEPFFDKHMIIENLSEPTRFIDPTFSAQPQRRILSDNRTTLASPAAPQPVVEGALLPSVQ